MKTMRMSGRIISAVLVVFLLLSVLPFAVSAEESDRFSEEYTGTAFYTQLQETLEKTADKTAMERTLAVAQSQMGYLNYSVEGTDIDKAKADGLIWTGSELRMNEYNTGNTEYTRWYVSHVAEGSENECYYDYDWCAIFVSWCLYQSGYYSEESLKKYYYTPSAEPRITEDADSWIWAFNLDQRNVYYTPSAQGKLEAWDYNTYYNTDVDPYELPYKPGGLIFFSWDGSGDWFNHVAFVVDYDKDEHVLTYLNGNFSGQVMTEEIDLDETEAYRSDTTVTQNTNRIMAYADYDYIKPLEEKEITADPDLINWSRYSSSGLAIQTNSEAIIGKVYVDDEYIGSNVESNMIFREGNFRIGKSEIRDLSDGEHDLLLSFEDGEVHIRFNIYTPYLRGDADDNDEIDINDATLLQSVLSDLAEDADGNIAKRGNVSGDELDASDITNIQKYLAGYGNEYNIGETVEEKIS